MPNAAFMIAVLEPWDERDTPELGLRSIMQSIAPKFAAIPRAVIIPFTPPLIPGLGTTGGFEFVLQDTEGRSPQSLSSALNGFIFAANGEPQVTGVFSTFGANSPQLFIDVNRQLAKTKGVSIEDIFTVLNANIGSYYVNDFNKFGRVYRVYIQAEADRRSKPGDIGKLYVRSADREMVPLRSLITVKLILGPETIERYNLFQSATVNGNPASGYSSGQAIATMGALAKSNLPDGYAYKWTGMSYEEVKASAAGSAVFVLSSHLRLSLSRRAVRELDRSVVCDAVGRVRDSWRICGTQAHGRRAQHLRTSWPHSLDRSGSEERHPHCGVRQGET